MFVSPPVSQSISPPVSPHHLHSILLLSYNHNYQSWRCSAPVAPSWCYCPIPRGRTNRLSINNRTRSRWSGWGCSLRGSLSWGTRSILIRSASVCESTHQPAGAPEAGGACETMWALISFPQPELDFFSPKNLLIFLCYLRFHFAVIWLGRKTDGG